MKLSATATFALLLALPACGTEKDDSATDTMTATEALTDNVTNTDATAATDPTAGTDTTDATDAGSSGATDATDPTATTVAPTTGGPTTGEPTTGESSTGESSTGEPSTGSPGLSFATDVWAPIMLSECGCHQGDNPGGLLMGADADSAYAAMVNVLASNGMNYVTPGEPINSYVFHKVVGTQTDVGGDGSLMPLGAPALDPAQVDTIKAWINDGAAK